MNTQQKKSKPSKSLHIFLGVIITVVLYFMLMNNIAESSKTTEGPAVYGAYAFMAILTYPIPAIMGGIIGWLIYREKASKR